MATINDKPPSSIGSKTKSSQWTLEYTPLEEIPATVDRCRRGASAEVLLALDARKKALRNLIDMFKKYTTELQDAVYADLRKPSMEYLVAEENMVVSDAWEAISHLDSWASPKGVEKNLPAVADDCHVHPEPLGTVLIIGAWNYPVQLLWVAAVGAIAAGNTVVLKPSEVAPATAAVMTKMTAEYFAPSMISVVNGGVKETTELLKEKFDHIFYTGNGRVGRIVMAAAAKHLTPVTLELGGKSPCVVDDNCDLKIAARRIVWGRITNAGQTCVAPDYLLVKPDSKAELIKHMKEALVSFLGEDPAASPDYTRIVSDVHFNRLVQLMDVTKNGGTIVCGGQSDAATRYIAPTIIDNVRLDSEIMQDEIFGPLFPLVEYHTVREAIDFIRKRDKPLALYIFSKNGKFADSIIQHTSSGAVLVNDTLMHAAVPGLPFGGVGESGMGAYHGKLSFDVFTHKKAVMKRKQMLEGLNDIRYPPYSAKKLKQINMLSLKTGVSRPWLKWVLLLAFLIIGGVAVFLGIWFRHH